MKNLILTFRRIFFVTIFIALMTTISSTIDANDGIEGDKNLQADSNVTKESILPISSNDAKPKIEFNFVGITPKTPMVGQDFTVEYELIPHPFQHNVSKPKEIVLVLDKSGSMKDNNKMSNLKTAATNFIKKLTAVQEGTKTPLITNLKISIVVYDASGSIEQDLVQVTDAESVKEANVNKLLNTINNLKADGGTNTGDGLRKGAYVLDKSDSSANKTLILMSDGLPTYYTYKTNWWGKQEFYTELNNNNGSIGGNGSSDRNGNCLDYAKTIGAIIKSKNYNVYSIGYGLGNDNSEANKKLKQIHESMGGVSSGENSTFFATDSGAIDSVFSSIADQLQKSYAFNDAQFNFDLNDSFTFESESNDGVFRFDPIVYNLGEGNWYRAEKQTIRFTLKSSQAGGLTLFSHNPTVSYTDIYGVSQTILIPNRTISVASYSTDKLQVDLGSNSNGYLIGDTIKARVTATHPGSNLEWFSDLTYNLIEIPDNFEVEKNNLNFGTVSESITKNITISIKNDEEVTGDNEKVYLLKGSYQYNVTKYQITTSQSGENSLDVPVRRGQIKVKVVDESNQNITQLATVRLKDSDINPNYEDGYLVFDTVPSGNYEVVLESLPEGLEINEENKNAFVRVSYNQNIAEYTFQAQGTYEEESYPNILAELKDYNPKTAYNGQEIEVTYQIKPQSFNDATFLNTQDKNIAILFDVSQDNKYLDSYMMNALDNMISQHFRNNKGKFAIIPYSDTVEIKTDDTNHPNGWYDQIHQFIRGLKTSSSNERKLGEALRKANSFFNELNNGYSNHIVIVTMGNPTDEYPNLDFSQYNIVVLAVNKSDEKINTDYLILKEWFDRMSISLENYIVGENDGNKINNEYGTSIKDKLIGTKGSGNKVINSSLNFDLGEKFLSLGGLTVANDPLYQLEIPQIIYNATTQNEDGTYKFEADPFEVLFKVKVNTKEIGNITFNNIDDVDVTNITYTDFKGKEVKNLIQTPVIEVIEAPSVSPIVNDSINILEIQPADSFTLTGSSDLGKIKTGTEDCTINVDDIEYEVSITHMSMPEFIGKAEKIDGKYDVIVLGRYVDSSITNSNDELNQYRYRDYYYDRGNNNEENDITVRKANELIEFMNKNQLVYIDSNIINNTTNSNSDYMKTNLYKIFSDNQNRSQKNVKTNFTTSKDSGNSMVTLQQVIRDYISLDTKEKGFAITLIDPVPNDITTDDINAVDGKAENRNRYLDLTVKNADNSKENVTLNLYLDLNGDGLYSEDEIAVSRNHLSLPLENYELNFSVHPDFIGLLEWKLEVIREDTNQTKTYLTGSNFFHRLTEEKKKINVLQITAQSNYATVDGEGNTESNKDYQVLNLKSNDDFTNLLSTVELKDYDITIDIIHYEQYIKYLNSLDDELDEYELKIKYLNGYYDMVICGFQDVYGRNAFGGENNQLVDSLIEFVRTGQGLMLTHDTIEKNDTPSMFNTFRVFTGQSRYPTLSNGEIVNDFNGATISYDLNIRGNNTNGFTIWGLMGDSEGATNSMSTGVYRTNNALITSYPYVLSDEEEEGLLRIRRTHGQYYQLNLEDEEVIPWYSFSANNKGENGGRRPQFNTWINSVNPYDVRNNYYTYSKGNITFSGTGEQRREYIHYPKSELKLFVNTIIKAERGANHRPTVEVQNIESGQQISLSQNKIEFNVIPRDIDLDLMDVTVEVSACKNNKCSVVGTPIVYEDRKDNESFQVTLNQDFLSQVEKDANQLKIKVYAVDEHQAKSEEVIKTLEIVDLDLLTVSLYPQDGNTRFLVGDTISLVADFSKSENYKNDYIELNYNLNSIPSYLTLSGESSRKLGTLTSESIQTVYELTVQADSAFSTSTISSTKVGGESRYCINSCSTVIAGTQSSPLEIKKGQIRIKLISEQFSEQLLQTSLTIRNQSDQVWTVTPNSAGEFIIDNVPTGSYSLTVELPDGLKTFEVIQQNGDESQTVDLTTPLQFNINFENNLFEANFTFIEPQTDINHGLYGGLDESNNQFEIIPSEITQTGEDLRKEFVGGSIVNFAGTFTYKSPLQSIQLLVDKKLNVSKENIKAYEILIIESGLELKEIENVDIYVARQKSEDLIMFNFINRISANTPVLIHYSVTVPDINDGIYTNTLKVGTKEKLTSIKSIKQIDENSSENLPYLF